MGCGLAALLVLAAPQVLACTLVPLPAGERFGQAHAVVLARPLAASVQPRRAAQPGWRGKVRQTVQWQVEEAWKGPYRAGARFTTRQRLVLGPGLCDSLLPLDGDTPRLLYLFDPREPHAAVMALVPAAASDELSQLRARASARD